MRWLAFGIAAVMLSSCTPQAAPKKIILRISSWAGAGDDSEAVRLERDAYYGFQKLHPEVEIQLESVPGSQEYVRKMLLSYVAGTEPDIIKLDASSAAVFINNGAVRDLTPYFKPADLEPFFPNVLNIARRGAALYAVPIDFTPMVLYYNKKMFREAGVPEPQPGWTWADFLNSAQKLTKPGQLGFVFPNWMPGWLPIRWNNGGDVLGPEGKAVGTADSAENAEALTFFRDLIDKYKVAPSLSQMAAQGVAPFPSGTAAMEISGHWNLTVLAGSKDVPLEDVGIAPLPVAQKGMKPVTVIYEAGWGIGKNCKHPELAAEFIKYFTSQKVQREYQKSGIGVCARRDIAEERAQDPRERTFLQIIPSGRSPWGASIEGYDFVESEGQRMMDSILKSGADPATALRAFARKVDRQLEDL